MSTHGYADRIGFTAQRVGPVDEAHAAARTDGEASR
jgi:hypothetical protein